MKSGLRKDKLRYPFFRWTQRQTRLENSFCRQLNKLEVTQIAEIMLKEVFGRLTEKGIVLEVTDRFKDRLITEGYSPSYGASPLRRAIINWEFTEV